MTIETLLSTAHKTLLAPYSLDQNALDHVFRQIMTHQVDYADLDFQYSRSEDWSLEEGQVKSGSFHIGQGVGVRAVSGEKTAFAYSDDINLAALESAAHEPGSREHLTVLGGVLEVESGDTRARLKTGETARYAADRPHAIRHNGRAAAQALLVVLHPA